MPKKIKVSDLPEFDITEHLNSEEAIARVCGALGAKLVAQPVHS